MEEKKVEFKEWPRQRWDGGSLFCVEFTAHEVSWNGWFRELYFRIIVFILTKILFLRLATTYQGSALLSKYFGDEGLEHMHLCLCLCLCLCLGLQVSGSGSVCQCVCDCVCVCVFFCVLMSMSVSLSVSLCMRGHTCVHSIYYPPEVNSIKYIAIWKYLVRNTSGLSLNIANRK